MGRAAEWVHPEGHVVARVCVTDVAPGGGIGDANERHGSTKVPSGYWTTMAVTMPNMPASDSTWLRMWQCHTHVPTWSAWNSAV